MKKWSVFQTRRPIWIKIGLFRVGNTVNCFCESERWPSTRHLL